MFLSQLANLGALRFPGQLPPMLPNAGGPPSGGPMPGPSPVGPYPVGPIPPVNMGGAPGGLPGAPMGTPAPWRGGPMRPMPGQNPIWGQPYAMPNMGPMGAPQSFGQPQIGQQMPGAQMPQQDPQNLMQLMQLRRALMPQY